MFAVNTKYAEGISTERCVNSPRSESRYKVTFYFDPLKLATRKCLGFIFGIEADNERCCQFFSSFLRDAYC